LQISMAEPRVLFVGNSATYFNDLPEMLRRLVPGLKYGQVTKGGQCLSGHANDPSVRWMITGEGPAPGAHIGLPRFSHGKDFFSDGEGWDVLVLQDRADSIGDWTRNEADVSRLNESLRALDVLASWVQIAAKKMRRRPSIVLYHRCLFDYNMLSNIDVRTARALCARGAEGILKYAGRLEARLGTDVPVRLLPAHEAFTLVHEEGQDVFRQLYAGDGEHNSRIGSYLVALLLFRLVTGQSPLGALDFRPVDDRSRLHVDMRQSPAEWLPSDDVQRQMWPWAPLPDVDENLAHRLRLWAHRVSSHPVKGEPQLGTPVAKIVTTYQSEVHIRTFLDPLGLMCLWQRVSMVWRHQVSTTLTHSNCQVQTPRQDRLRPPEEDH
jgi:hypothetical protein